MPRNILTVLSFILLVSTTVAPALAHEEDVMEDENPATAAYVHNLGAVGDRVVQLAQAIPEENYDWRPMEGVRSVSEALMHMAGSSYYFAGRMGTSPPEDVDPSAMESITDKEEVVAAVEASLDHLAEAYRNVEDPGEKIDLFGNERTVEDLMLLTLSHVHEHFGQLIAYARSNEVVPPWSRSEE